MTGGALWSFEHRVPSCLSHTKHIIVQSTVLSQAFQTQYGTTCSVPSRPVPPCPVPCPCQTHQSNYALPLHLLDRVRASSLLIEHLSSSRSYISNRN